MPCTHLHMLHKDSVAMLRGCWYHVSCYAWQGGRTRNRGGFFFWSTSRQITNLLLTWIPSPWNHQEWGVLMFVENSRYIWTSVHLCRWNSAVWDCPKQWVLYHQTVFRFCDKTKKREEWGQLDQLFGHEDSQLPLVPLWKASTDSWLRPSSTRQWRVWDVLVLIDENSG